MSKKIMEVIALTLEDIIIAQANGANRIELCSGLAEGALTPSYGFMEQARKISHIPIVVMIRPRHGDSVYGEPEIAAMKRDIQVAKETGMDGVVFGVVDQNYRIAVNFMEELMMSVGSMEVTFTRIFDNTPDPMETIELLQKFSQIKRILTAGQADTVIAGAPVIKKFQSKAGNRISLMPGLGINTQNVVDIVRATSAQEFHIGVGVRTPESPFGTLDGNKVRTVRELLNNLG